jgi:membrane protease YdiL (CAAX protease family)
MLMPGTVLLLVLGLSFLLQAFGGLLGMGLAQHLLGVEPEALGNLGSVGRQLTDTEIYAHRLAQLVAVVGWFLLPALLGAQATGEPWQELRTVVPRRWLLLGLGGAIALAGIAPMQALSLRPEHFEALGPAVAAFFGPALAHEAKLEQLLTQFLGRDLVLNLLLIAVVPAVLEELFFRGWMLSTLRRMASVHVAVWVSAVLFSLLHFQVLGFVPRLLLGAVFGYLVVWGHSLWPAVVAHLAFNGLQVIVVYTSLQGVGPGELAGGAHSAADVAPWIWLPLALLFLALLGLYYRLAHSTIVAPDAKSPVTPSDSGSDFGNS